MISEFAKSNIISTVCVSLSKSGVTVVVNGTVGLVKNLVSSIQKESKLNALPLRIKRRKMNLS